MTKKDNFDPYKILRVKRTATSEEIKKAYRLLARKCHPDSGGTKEAFDRLNKAYCILISEKRRQHYDKTGDCDNTKPDNNTADMMCALSVCLDEVLVNRANNFQMPPNYDLVKAMTSHLVSKRKNFEEKEGELNKSLDLFKKVSGRFEESEGEGALEQITNFHIAQIQQHYNNNKHELDRLTRAIDYLKKCKFKFDKDTNTNGFFHTQSQFKIVFNT